MPKAKTAPARADKTREVTNGHGALRFLEAEEVDVDSLKPHPRNYKNHPDDQLVHIESSLKEFGLYRNVVIARDGTILAGHGVWMAAKRVGAKRLRVCRLDLDPGDLRAMKVMALDNELPRFGESDDRALSEMLKEIANGMDLGLLGTGYDETMLAALAMVTRPASELADFDAAAEWSGLPEYTPDGGASKRIVVQFAKEADRAAFMKTIKATVINKKTDAVWSIWWPERQKEDLAAVKFDVGGAGKKAEKSKAAARKS